MLGLQLRTAGVVRSRTAKVTDVEGIKGTAIVCMENQYCEVRRGSGPEHTGVEQDTIVKDG